MSGRSAFLAILALLFTLPTMAVIESNMNKLGQTLSFETCTQQIEDLRLCVENTRITVNSGEPVVIKVSWVNSSEIDRSLGLAIPIYSVTIYDEKGEKLIPVFLQRQMERDKRLAADSQPQMTEEDIKEFGRIIRRGGSSRGNYVKANQKKNNEIKLTDIMYDYDLTKKGKYKVTINQTTASLEKGKTIEFVLDNIELEIK